MLAGVPPASVDARSRFQYRAEASDMKAIAEERDKYFFSELKLKQSVMWWRRKQAVGNLRHNQLMQDAIERGINPFR